MACVIRSICYYWRLRFWFCCLFLDVLKKTSNFFRDVAEVYPSKKAVLSSQMAVGHAEGDRWALSLGRSQTPSRNSWCTRRMRMDDGCWNPLEGLNNTEHIMQHAPCSACVCLGSRLDSCSDWNPMEVQGLEVALYPAVLCWWWLRMVSPFTPLPENDFLG